MMLSTAKKATYLPALIAGFAARGLVGKKFIKDRTSKIQFYTKLTSEYSQTALKSLGFEVDVVGFDKEMMAKENFLMVCNHQSYWDILVTSSIIPCVFVTSVDMGEDKFLGTLAELGGSIFVERRNRSQVDRDLGQMTQSLKDGFNVLIYPEGTSTNGERVLPFKKSLLMSAPLAGRRILPMCLKYYEIDGEPFSIKNCDNVCWYGDMGFGPHFFNTMKLRKIRVKLQFLPPIDVTAESTRDELAEKSYTAVNGAFLRP